MPFTDEERKHFDRIYHKRFYQINKEEVREKMLEKYYERKRRDPTFHCKARGRPRKQDIDMGNSENVFFENGLEK